MPRQKSATPPTSRRSARWAFGARRWRRSPASHGCGWSRGGPPTLPDRNPRHRRRDLGDARMRRRTWHPNRGARAFFQHPGAAQFEDARHRAGSGGPGDCAPGDRPLARRFQTRRRRASRLRSAARGLGAGADAPALWLEGRFPDAALRFAARRRARFRLARSARTPIRRRGWSSPSSTGAPCETASCSARSRRPMTH